jgi:hypothetical protein
MNDDADVPLTITAIDFILHEGQLLYNFQVQFGQHHNWVISKTYDEFCLLHEELGGAYGLAVLPYLTGPVRPWARNSSSTGTDRLPKLESYLMEVVAVWQQWQPSIYVVKVPNPDDPSSRSSVAINQFLFVFLDFEQYLVLPGDDDPVVILNASEPASAMPSPALVAAPSPTASVPESPLVPSGPSLSAVQMDAEQTLLDDTLDLQTEASNVTKQVYLQIRNYTIYKDDRIDYHVHVTILGHHWILMKRYSEFAAFHKKLLAVYGPDQIPPVDESKVPAWRKLSPETGLMRQKFFNSYLRAVIVSIDTWDPSNLVTRFTVGDVHVGRDVCVCINQLLFEFLGFERHIQEFKLSQAEEALGRQMRLMSDEEKDVLERKRLAEQQAKIAAALAKRRSRLEPFPQASFDTLTEHVAAMEDDRDISALLQKVVQSGCYPVDGGGGPQQPESPTADPDLAWKASAPVMESPSSRGRAFPPRRSNAPPRTEAVVGFSSAQLAKLCRVLYFNDTRVETIRLFAPLLTDLDAVDDVTATLLYHWDEAKTEIVTNIVP